MAKRNRDNSIDMVNGPLLKNIFIFAVPLMFTNFLQILFNAADTIVVGKFSGQNALAAVGATGSIVFLLTALFNGLGMGSNVVIANLLGSKDDEKINKAVHTSICIAILGGVVLGLLGIFLARPLLELMSTPSDIIKLSTLYMRIYFVGIIFTLVYNFGAAILRSKGDTKRPLYFLMISGVLNFCLNLFFVVVLKMSVAGVALATIISQGVSCVLVCWTLTHETDATRLEISKLKLDGRIAKEIMRIGIPAGIQGMVFSISNVVIQSSINSFNSSIIVAGNSAGGNIEGFVYIGMMAFTQATVTFTSQNVGAKNYKGINKILWLTFVLTTVSGFLVAFVVWLFGSTFLSFYTNEQAVVDVGMIRLTYVALWLWINGVLDVFVASMRGMGYSTLPTIFTLFGICGFRLLWIWTVFPTHPTLEVIYLSFPLSWIITSVVQAMLWFVLHRRKLKTAAVEG